MQAAKRSVYLDILKILACFLVCLNHSEAFHWFLGLPADGSALTLTMTTISILATMNVPLYFMVSGALLLKKEETYGTVFRKRILRFAVLLAVVTLLKCLLIEPEEFTVIRWIRTIGSGSICVSYWFLYAYLGILLMLPLLQRIAQVLRSSDVLMMIGLRFMVTFLLPVGNAGLEALFFRPITISGSLQLPFSTCDILFYPLVGFHLANLPREQLTRRLSIVCWITFFAGTALNLAVVCYYGSLSGFSQTYIGLSAFLSDIAVFLLIRRHFEGRKVSERISRLLANVSGCTLGIYISESFLWDYLAAPYNNILWQLSPVPRVLGSVLWCLMIMGAGCCITWLVRRLPFCRNLL